MAGLKLEHVGGKKSTKGWKGILYGEERNLRLMTMVMLLVIIASLTFMQLGFIGVGSGGVYICYVMSLLAPVALAAYLFGTRPGFLVGLFAGGIQYAHAIFQPLDLYEKYFVTLSSSVLLYALYGLLAGALFGIAFKREISGKSRYVRIGIVAAICDVLHFVGFYVITLATLSIRVATEQGLFNNTNTTEVSISNELVRALLGTGDILLQLVLDFLLVLVTCVIVDIIIQRYKRIRDDLELGSTFRGWLFAVFATAFLLTVAVVFAIITEREANEAHTKMKDEVSFLVMQFENRSSYEPELNKIVDDYSLDEDDAARLNSIISGQELLEGYSIDADGLVAVLSPTADNDMVVALTDDPNVKAGTSTSEIYGKVGSETIRRAAESDDMIQTIYDINLWSLAGDSGDVEEQVDTKTEIGYMVVGKTHDGMYVVMVRPSSTVFEGRAGTVSWMTVLALVLLTVVFLITSRLLEVFVIRNIDTANDALAKITDGDLNQRIGIETPREFRQLSEGINTTVDALKGLIGESERRMERDLITARAIQEGALPRTFPPFPEIDAFDIFSSMDPAKEVGGDFYDFFLIDDHTLGFLIADVSGKGIPGALFMMAAKSELRNYLSTGMDVRDAVASANVSLCEKNEAGMFVTVWAAKLDWTTGELTYVNAGHNFPLVRRGLGGEWEWLKRKCGLFLGTFETAKYREETIVLRPGDELLLYTDGVNEAFSINGEEFGNDRLETFLDEHKDLHPRDLVRSLRSDVAAWASGAEQSDDVTILALEFGTAPEVTGTIEVPAELSYLDDVIDMVDVELVGRLCPVGIRHRVEVALEELFVNVCRYAYADKEEPGMVRVSYAYGTNPSSITVELVDQGIPFDPLTLGDPTKPSSIQEAKIGGLGIFMVRKSMDDFSYVHDAGNNVVAFSKRW